MIRAKSQGPSFVPCGTIAGTFPDSEKQSFPSLTYCCLLVRKSAVQLIVEFKMYGQRGRMLFDNQTVRLLPRLSKHLLLPPNGGSFLLKLGLLKSQGSHKIGWEL